MGTYKLLHSSVIYDRYPVSEYISSGTGITVVIAEVDGPIVTGRFSIATGAYDDGLPTALKGLLFLGSEDFPQNIDSVILKRCLGSEIDSWLDNDHTSYTIETVGAEGFLNILPIMSEYILYPLLREEDYKNRVHHVTKEGKDTGAMFEELQKIEESFPYNFHATILNNVYPGKCSYASVPRATTNSLREATTIDKVRNYHKEFYRPENLKIIIAGVIKADEVFKVLEKLEEKIISKGDIGTYQKSLQTPPQPLTDAKDLVIKYPADNEDSGHFYMTWRSVSCTKESYTLLAITILLDYLTESSVSPLLKEFVKSEDSYASRILNHVIENGESCMYIHFDDVPVDKLPKVGPKLHSVLKSIIENKNIDMKLMESLITKNELKDTIILEDDCPSHKVLGVIENYIVYESNQDFHNFGNPLTEINKLLKEPQSFWLSLLGKYFVDNKYVAVQFVPSAEQKKNISKNEKGKAEDQAQNLERLDLKQGDILEKTTEDNEERTSPDTDFAPIPNLDSIKFHNVERYDSDSRPNQRVDLSQTCVFTYFDHVNTSTVFIQALLDTSEVPLALQSYLPIFFESLMELPLERDGLIISQEEVEKQLEADIVYRWTDARAHRMPQMAAVTLEVENGKFQIGLKWLKELLYKTVFTVDSLKSIVKKQDIYSRKPGGQEMIYDAIYRMCCSKDSSVVIDGNLKQHKFLTELIEKLDSDDSKEIFDNMEKVRKIITEPSKVYLYLVGNLHELKNPVEVINTLLPPELGGLPKKRQRFNPVFKHNFLEFNDSLNGCIIEEDDTNNGCCYQATKCITSFVDADYPALWLYVEYLNQDQGYLHQQIQNAFVTFNIEIEEGLLYGRYRIIKDTVEAYKKIKEMVTTQLEKREWDKSLLESTRRSILFEIIVEESTISGRNHVSRKAFLCSLEYSYHRKLYDSIKNVTIEDLHRVGQKYVAQLFNPEKSKTAIVTHPTKVTETAEGLKKLGLDLTVYSSPEDFF